MRAHGPAVDVRGSPGLQQLRRCGVNGCSNQPTIDEIAQEAVDLTCS
ncbi:MAG: hypothetical protein RIB67_03205 [Miltoncostaeaceae bacterium]